MQDFFPFYCIPGHFFFHSLSLTTKKREKKTEATNWAEGIGQCGKSESPYAWPFFFFLGLSKGFEFYF